MPQRKSAWSSWNSITKENKTCVTYWLNKLQNLKTKKNYFLTLNPVEKINEENVVKSPMVGVAYLSADPDSPPYVKIGQHVKAGDILLLIEAMKTFNEIKAPKSGVIKKIVALNSQPVDFGDHLIIFE